MGSFLVLARTIDRASEAIGKTVGWLILVAILVSAVNAVVRKIFNVSSNSFLELQWYLYGAAFLLASAQTLKQNEHIRIDIVYGALSRRRQHWIDLLGHLVFLMPFVVLMDIYLVPYVLSSYRSGEMSNNAGGLILWPAKLLLLLGFALLTLQGLAEIIKKIAIMRGAMEDPTPFISTHKAAELEGEKLAEVIEK
ncbi:TRAP transporter small permease subunit [bacterium]|nr:TRAP transporter small permease subunit [bacterium]